MCLNSTDPAQIRALQAKIDLADTLFIVSSKSGQHHRTQRDEGLFLRARRRRSAPRKPVTASLPSPIPARRCRRSRPTRASRRIFHGDPTIGGRYSVLSPFGLVPAAAAGSMCACCSRIRSRWCAPAGPTCRRMKIPACTWPCHGPRRPRRPRQGHHPVIGKIADFGAWAEQLIAESTGKDGKGLIPIDGETLGDVALYGHDRFFIDIRTEGENDAAHDNKLAALEKAGHPVVRIVMKSTDHIGQEFFRFEMATAVAGAVSASIRSTSLTSKTPRSRRGS